MRKYCGYIGICFSLLFVVMHQKINSVGINISAKSGPRTFVEFITTNGDSWGAMYSLSQGSVKIDTGVEDIKRIRWMIGCTVYELNETIPGTLGWKDCYINDDTIQFTKSTYFLFEVNDPVIGSRTGKLLTVK